MISYDKLYISAVRQAYLDTTGLCAVDEGYAPYSLHLIPIGGSAHRLLICPRSDPDVANSEHYLDPSYYFSDGEIYLCVTSPYKDL